MTPTAAPAIATMMTTEKCVLRQFATPRAWIETPAAKSATQDTTVQTPTSPAATSVYIAPQARENLWLLLWDTSQLPKTRRK